MKFFDDFVNSDGLWFWNTIAWIAANTLVAYISLVLVIFVTAYFILFNPRLTTGGRYIFRFFLSLIAIIGLIFIGLFIDPQIGRAWFQYPGDVIWWRPTVRLLGYAYVSYTVTSLASLLFIRKFFPERLRTEADLELVKTRSEPK